MQVGPAARLFRSVLVSMCMMSLAAGAHVVGGGSLPPAILVVALAVFALVPVTLLAGRRLSLPVLTGLLFAGQILLHSAFEMFSNAASCLGGTGHGAGFNHASTTAHCVPEGSGQILPHMIDAGASPLMLAAHLGAAGVILWMLARGEDAFWALIAWLRPLVRLPQLIPVVQWPQVEPYREDIRVPPSRRNEPVDGWRGPPGAMVVA